MSVGARTWRETQRDERARSWPAVGRILAELPPVLLAGARLAEFDLAIRCSPTGQARHVFTGVGQFPLASVGGWLVRDLAPSVADLDLPEARLATAALLLGLRDHIVERGQDQSTDDGVIVRILAERAVADLASIGPGRPTGFADGPQRIVARKALWASDEPPTDPSAYLLPRWSASARTVAAVALQNTGREDIMPAVATMLDELAAAYEITADLSTIHDDLLHDRITFPVATVAGAAGLPLVPRPDPTTALGALVVTGSIGAIRGVAGDHLRAAHAIARDLSLGHLEGFIADAEAVFDGDEQGRSPRIALERPPVELAIEMAEGRLLSDPSQRASWEVHREGMFGAPLVVSRFPAGLILEILARHGHDVSAGVDAFIETTVAEDFHYYDHPDAGVDADTIGVVLRLQPWASTPDRWADALDATAAVVDRAVAARGSIPVWIRDPAADRPSERPPTYDLGEHCGTVAAHLLLGLDRRGRDRHETTFATGAADLAARIAGDGLAANVNYTPAFALSVFGRCLALLDGSREDASEALLAALDRELGWPVDTPQRAALLTLACLELGAPDRIAPAWRTTILRGQGPDGGWPGEPFAVIPTKGRSVAWFANDLLTTAICYDALARLERSG